MDERPWNVNADYEYLISFLPEGWREKAKELGALRRCRKVPNADTLLRVLLVHLADGCSLRETAALAQQGGWVTLSDVAIMDRLREAGEWFRWMNEQILQTWVARPPQTVYGTRWNVRVVDGTRVCEPGPTGSSWLLHYAIALPSLVCTQVVTSHKGVLGETFKRFTVAPDDLFIGDRAYGVRPGIFHVTQAGGDVLVRFVLDNLPLETRQGRPFDLLAHLRRLGPREIGEWPVQLREHGQTQDGRVCAVRKSRAAAEKAQDEVRRQAAKNGGTPKPTTVEAAAFIFVFTTLSPEALGRREVLEMYRGRWQIELVFKRLKSILGLGHLRKTDEQAARAWLEGKLLVAFLVELLLCQGESFFPWGYPLPADR